ncbi:MAG: hypothetical protein ACHP7N_08110 [Caulobacterales bacterium]
MTLGEGESVGRGSTGRANMAALGFVLALAAAAAPARSLAAAPPTSSADVNAQLATLRAETEAQKTELQDQQNQLEQLRMELQAQTDILRRAGLLETASTSGSSRQAPGMQLIASASPPPAAAGAGSQASQGGASEDRPKSERQADQLLLNVGGVLLPPFTMQLEQSMDETHVSNPRVNIFGYTIFNAINIGTIRVDDLSQDAVNTAFSARMGLPFRTQVDVRIPYTLSFIKQTKGIGTGQGNISEVATHGYHLGDISTTLSWQPIVERGWIPAVVLRSVFTVPTGKSVYQIPIVSSPSGGAETDLTQAPTGAGYFSVQPGFTLVWRSDPLVLFMGATYQHPFPTRDYVVSFTSFDCNVPGKCAPGELPHAIPQPPKDYGHIMPGDVLGLSAGLNFTVNERASINFSFVDQFSDYTSERLKNTDAWTKLKGTSLNDARLGMGAAFGLTDNISLVINAGMGLTDQSPGYTFSIAVPITLPLVK